MGCREASSSLVARSKRKRHAAKRVFSFWNDSKFRRTRYLHPRAKRALKSEVRQGSCKWPKAICGMPGSEFEPRCPLQAETGHPTRMSCFFRKKANSLPPPAREARIKIGGEAGFPQMAEGHLWDAGKRVRASLPAPAQKFPVWHKFPPCGGDS